MIVRGSIDVGCDRCGETADLDREASTPLERVRAEAAEEGWLYIDGKDYCSLECAHEMVWTEQNTPRPAPPPPAP